MPFKDMVALITGGSYGIGFHAARAFLKKNMKGVGFTGRTERAGKAAELKLCLEFGPRRAIYFNGDSSQEKFARKSFEETIKTFGSLDVLFNNAGIVDEANWVNTISVNSGGTILNTRLAMMEYLVKSKSKEFGFIINNASISGLEPFWIHAVYSGTKHGIVAFARALGNEDIFVTSKIKIMTICPGLTQTSLIKSFDEEAHKGIRSWKLKVQSPEKCGEHVAQIILSEKNGSIWVSEADELYDIQFPPRESLRKPFVEINRDVQPCTPFYG